MTKKYVCKTTLTLFALNIFCEAVFKLPGNQEMLPNDECSHRRGWQFLVEGNCCLVSYVSGLWNCVRVFGMVRVMYSIKNNLKCIVL